MSEKTGRIKMWVVEMRSRPSQGMLGDPNPPWVVMAHADNQKEAAVKAWKIKQTHGILVQVRIVELPPGAA